MDMTNLTQELSHLALSDLTKYATVFCKNLVVALIVFFIGRFFIKRICRIIKAVLDKKGTNPSLDSFVESVLSITLNFVLIIIIVGVLGIETSSFLALFASAGVAIGMALSGTLQNFAGGVMVVLFHPYKIGDYIEAQGYAGTVKDIQIFNTILTTPDNQTVVIPNGGLSTGSLRNFSTESTRRIDIDVEVAYGTQPSAVREALTALTKTDSRVIKECEVYMTQMGSSSIVFSWRMWVETKNYWSVKFDMTEKVYNKLNELGIEIPFQQIDVHVRNN